MEKRSTDPLLEKPPVPMFLTGFFIPFAKAEGPSDTTFGGAVVWANQLKLCANNTPRDSRSKGLNESVDNILPPTKLESSVSQC